MTRHHTWWVYSKVFISTEKKLKHCCFSKLRSFNESSLSSHQDGNGLRWFWRLQKPWAFTRKQTFIGSHSVLSNIIIFRKWNVALTPLDRCLMDGGGLVHRWWLWEYSYTVERQKSRAADMGSKGYSVWEWELKSGLRSSLEFCYSNKISDSWLS